MKEEAQMYDIEITMIQGGKANNNLIKKHKALNIEFNIHDPIPIDHHGTEALVIMGAVGRTLIRRIYVDNGSSVNIIYEHCLKYLPSDAHNYVQPATSVVVGLAGQSIWPVGRVSLPFTLKDYMGSMHKTILTEFIVIRASSPYNMLLGRTTLWKL